MEGRVTVASLGHDIENLQVQLKAAEHFSVKQMKTSHWSTFKPELPNFEDFTALFAFLIAKPEDHGGLE